MPIETGGDGRREAFWMKLAAVAFGAWSVMIPIGVTLVTRSVDRVVNTQEEQLKHFNEYVVTMERRVTIIEQRQDAMLESLRSLKAKP